MKLNKNIVLTEIAGEYVAVPVGAFAEKNKAVFRLNETGYRIFKAIEAKKSIDEIAKSLTDEYEIDIQKAKEKTEEYISKLKEAGILED